MLAATVIAVFLIPVSFSVVERVSHRFSKGGRVTLDSVHAPELEIEKDRA
jgi:HAE1 family hydrophobic/amphiphilic exporter-1